MCPGLFETGRTAPAVFIGFFPFRLASGFVFLFPIVLKKFVSRLLLVSCLNKENFARIGACKLLAKKKLDAHFITSNNKYQEGG
mmetsp:Transcript_16069/g.22966  ORF Transcript_16069/g.22966 Transcript_16069/m.22966 type:complete len:84 (+) Transcript_16069:484-735(+)